MKPSPTPRQSWTARGGARLRASWGAYRHGAAVRTAAVRTAGVGFGAGLINGMLGVGGGILIVPGLILLRGASPRVAVSTSLATVMLLSIVGFAAHVALSGFHFSLSGAGVLLVTGIAGAQVGSALLNHLPQRWILYLFSLLTWLASLNLIAQGLHLWGPAGGAATAPSAVAFAVIGLVAGFFSGMLGIGGGGVAVLALASLYSTPVLVGLPLALAINIINSASGVAAQWRTGHIHWREVARMVPPAVLGIASGVLVAVALPADALRVAFAGFFLWMGVRLFLKGRQA